MTDNEFDRFLRNQRRQERVLAIIPTLLLIIMYVIALIKMFQ